MKILDSDHCIAILRGSLDLRNQTVPDEQISVTAVSVGEPPPRGAEKSADPAKNLARVNLLVSTIPILPFDEHAACRFGALKAELERQGNSLADLDLQIASIALVHDAVLLTHNQRHFGRITALSLEDWL